MKKQVHRLKDRRQKIAYLRFETEPGYQAQVDFGEFQITEPDGSVTKLYLLTFLQRHANILFLGPPGVGKTHPAVALAIKACQTGYYVAGLFRSD